MRLSETMINSVTGFGGAEGQLGGVTYSVEIKTVNNRYFKHRIKLPDAAAFLEEDIEKLLRKHLHRGTVNFVLNLKNISADTLFDVDDAALRSYVEKLKEMATHFDLENNFDLGNLLTLPGIVQPKTPDEDTAAEIRDFVIEMSENAIDELKQMRSVEGASIAADFAHNCESISDSIDEIRKLSGRVTEEYQEKLFKRLNSLMSGVKYDIDEASIAREVAIMAERCDISEELSRLESHIQQFLESCELDGQAGRKLDFISQEMLREANTIASKASDSDIARYVVDMKCRIDRIKEQVQNVE